MDYEIVRYVIIGAIVFGITIFFLRSFIRAALIAIVVVFLFRVGWVYTGDDIRDNLLFNKIFHPDFIESAIQKYDEFTEKRDSLGEIIDPEALEDAVKDGLQDKVDEFLNGNTDNGEDDIKESPEEEVPGENDNQ